MPTPEEIRQQLATASEAVADAAIVALEAKNAVTEAQTALSAAQTASKTAANELALAKSTYQTLLAQIDSL